MSEINSNELPLAEAIRVLLRAGAVFSLPAENGAKSVSGAAAWLDLSPGWVKEHLEEFPGWYRLPAGSSCGRNVGEIRIPVRDLVEFERRRQKARAGA